MGNLVPNGGFEAGTNGRPSSWTCQGERGEWVSGAREGARCIAIGRDGRSSSSWQTTPLPLVSGGLYRLEFFSRKGPDTSGGCVVSGIEGVNHDFNVTEQWQPYGFTFVVPDHVSNSWVRLGQWEVNGKVFFDDVTLRRVQAVHSRYINHSSLGEGESVQAGVYRFNANLGWRGANFHRTLCKNRCGFNSDRWTFGAESEVIYRHDLPVVQTNGSVRLNLNYYTGGSLKVDASRDGVEWVSVGVFDGQRRNGSNDLPGQLFPSTNIFVRLRSSANANLQVNAYEYQARLSGKAEDATGQTQFFEVLEERPDIAVSLEAVNGEGEEQITRSVGLVVSNLSNQLQAATLSLKLDGKEQDPVRFQLNKPGASPRRVAAECQLDKPGRHKIIATIAAPDQTVLFSGKMEVNGNVLADPRAGYWAGGNEKLQLWWCESGWKVGRSRQWPNVQGEPKPIVVSAAKGELEPVQVILHPTKSDVRVTGVSVRPLVDNQGHAASVATQVQRVEYVHVTHPTDSTCLAGWYPDPLPSLQLPLLASKGQNTLLWVTFQVASNAVAGDYSGAVELETSEGKLSVPVRLHVHDFALPRETHLRSALGLSSGSIDRFHHLKDTKDRQLVYERYLKNFAEHRITPYSFYDYAQIEVKFSGDGTNKKASVDFTKFDQAAARWLDQEKFNSFLLPLHGMGGGTFQSRRLGTLEGFTEGTPEHARLFADYLGQVEQHLRERGWLDKAYAYWFDEPDQKDFEFVAAGMKRIKAASPGLKRMLTKQPAPLLEGNVDIWCALTPEWTPEKVRERRAANQEVWWYICCGPTAPYITEFIDHPGTELRLWPWQSWQYGVQGILIWETAYWTSSSAFPGPAAQNPWEDPMSYVSDYDFGPGHIGYWGNGDGRFLYPSKEAMGSDKPCLDGPVNSVRWENLRDGMEDYEYLWILEQAIKKREANGGDPELLKQARELLKVPAEISQDTTHFTTDPRPILAHRERVAKMIERLQ